MDTISALGTVLIVVVYLVALLALPILVLFALVRAAVRSALRSERGGPWEPAEDILRDRFARGEIDASEYQEARRILGLT